MVAGPSGSRPVGSFCGPMSSVSNNDDNSTSSHHQNPNGGGRSVQAFMNGIIGPFMACWQPPITACVSPTSPYGGGCMGPVSPGSQDRHMPPASPLATTNISQPHPNDVLCGRGGATNSHVGNLNFRSLVAANKGVYVTLTKKQKMLMARAIVNTVRRQEPPGRFLQKNTDTGLWFDIGVPRSLEKTSQALREKTAADKAAANTVDDRDGSEAGTRTPEMNTPNNSAPSSPVSTPIRSHRSSSTHVEAPEIIIPDHLEAQFNPQLARRRMAYQDYPPHPSQQQLYLPNFGPDPRKSAERAAYSHGYMHHPGGPPPPPPPPPPPIYHAPPRYDYQNHRPLRRSIRPPPPPPPQQQYPHKSMHHFPPSPTSSSVVTPDYGSPPRRGGAPDVSPGRRQEWKRRRASEDSTAIRVPDGDAGSASSLHQDMATRLSFQEHRNDIASPSSVLQSRSRRLSTEEEQGLAGLAALSSAAMLKLHEGD